jgi:diketogulonate reductase-like aldo/keto reductase
MHWPNPSVPFGETLGALTELQEEWSVKHAGVSNFPPSMVEEAARYATVFCNQVEYYPYRAQDQLLQRQSKWLSRRTVAAVLEEGAGVLGTERRDRRA